MTIKLNEKSYIVGVWFSEDPETKNNWMATVIKDPDNPGKYKGQYRFRYKKDDKVFDSEDEKSWYEFYYPSEAEEDALIFTIDNMQKAISPGYPLIDNIIVKGNLEKLLELGKDKPWMNIKEVK